MKLIIEPETLDVWQQRELEYAGEDPEKIAEILVLWAKRNRQQAETIGSLERRAKLLEKNLENYKMMNGFKSGDGILAKADLINKYERQLRLQRNRFTVLSLIQQLADEEDTLEDIFSIVNSIVDYYEIHPQLREMAPNPVIEDLGLEEALELREFGSGGE